MAITPFVFKSENLPRLKAKQLSKAFPFLKLAAAQEATARALGYASWYECTSKGTHGEPSLPDLEAGMPTRIGRYYHQAGVLIGLGIAPSEADIWVRGWGLTGKPTLAPERAVPQYYLWKNLLDELARGEITEEFLISECSVERAKYPEINRPIEVCPGVIVGPLGRYPHYAVDPAINAKIPIYLRGPSALYHYEDDVDVLVMCVPGFPDRTPSKERVFPRLSWVQHEWHYGEMHPDADEMCVPNMVAAALAIPDSKVVIAQRAMPEGRTGFNFDLCALACLTGKDFAAYLLAKGDLDTSKVIWYQNIDSSRFQTSHMSKHAPHDWDNPVNLVVFDDADKHQPSLPLYSYPFMNAPMGSDETAGIQEAACLLPLDRDYPEDDDDGGDDDEEWDDDGPSGPAQLLDEMLNT